METDFERSRLEKTKQGLYEREYTDDAKRAKLSPSDVEVQNDWIEETPQYQKAKQPIGISFLKGIIMLMVVAATGVLAFLGYKFMNPSAQPSSALIQFVYDIPVSVPSGVEVPVRVRVLNQNPVGMEYANVTVRYPKGTKRVQTDGLTDVSEDSATLGAIAQGAYVEYELPVLFFGEENVDQELSVQLEYRFDGISSVFEKSEKRPIRISSSPINLTVDTLDEINAGQTLDLAITARANSAVKTGGILLRAEYPEGFQFLDATPKPAIGNNIWNVGELKPGDKFSVRVRGILAGEETSGKIFRTQIGVVANNNEREIGTVFASSLNEVRIKKPFIGITLMFGGQPVVDSVANFGESIKGEIVYQNNINTKVTNAQIEVRLKGTAFNRSRVNADDGGYYRSIDDTIFWDERGKSELSLLNAGESGVVSFTFVPLPPIVSGQVLRNPYVTAEITVRGKRLSESGVPEEIKTVVVKNVRLISEAQFTPRSVYGVGPFANRGVIPPRVEKETTYTVIWTIVNTSNDLRDGVVRATLPPYVRWMGSVSPSSEQVVYNKNTNEVVWTVGKIGAGVGIGASPAREVAFQIAFLPSISQVGSSPSLLTGQTFTAVDVFTQREIFQEKTDVSTILSTDPTFDGTEGKVVE